MHRYIKMNDSIIHVMHEHNILMSVWQAPFKKDCYYVYGCHLIMSVARLKKIKKEKKYLSRLRLPPIIPTITCKEPLHIYPLSHFIRTIVHIAIDEKHYHIAYRDSTGDLINRTFSRAFGVSYGYYQDVLMEALEYNAADVVIPAKTEFLQSYLPTPIAREIAYYWL
jgi:hypothetical protein